MRIERLITMIKRGSIHLPNFQRGYIWKPTDIVELMNSLYHEYPVGMVTTWEAVDEEGQLIVDGQQRLSSLYACYTDEVPEIQRDADKKPRTGYTSTSRPNSSDSPPKGNGETPCGSTSARSSTSP